MRYKNKDNETKDDDEDDDEEEEEQGKNCGGEPFHILIVRSSLWNPTWFQTGVREYRYMHIHMAWLLTCLIHIKHNSLCNACIRDPCI